MANQATLTISNTVLTNVSGTSVPLTTSGGSGNGAVSYSVSGTGCSISGGSLSASTAATCVVTATKAASTGFNSVTSAAKSFVFTNAAAAQAATAPANQATLTISNTTLAVIPGSTLTLATTGGSGTGAVSYTVSGTGCSISGSSLTASSVATCVVTATKAASTGFNATTSATKSFSFASEIQAVAAPTNQATLTISNTTLTAIPGSTITLATTGGSGSGAVSYSVSGTGCSVSGSSLTASAAATCVVTATKAASTGFNAITSATKSFSFANANQQTLTISNTALTGIPGSTFTLTTTGGSGNGAVSFEVVGTGCSVSGNSLTASIDTRCVVTATKASSTGFNSATSATRAFNFVTANQNPLVVYPVLLAYLPGTSITLSAIGGSGTGAVNYEVTGNGCTLNGSTLTSSIETTCTAWANKAASAGFNSITSDRKGYVFRNQSQATLSISNTTLRNLPGTSLSLTTTGGSGTGDISFTVSGADCVLTGASLVAATVTNCVVTASKAASDGFRAATSSPTTFVYALADQAALSVSNSVLTGFTGTPISLTTSGGSGTGDVTFQVNGTGCSVSGNMLSATSATTCYVTAIKSGSAGFNPVGSGTASFTFKVPFAAPTITSTFAKKDSIKVDYIVEPGITYKLVVRHPSGTPGWILCGEFPVCRGSNTSPPALTPLTTYKVILTATRLTETSTTELLVTTYASIELAPSIISLTQAYRTFTGYFNPQSGWRYSLRLGGTCFGSASGPFTTTSPAVLVLNSDPLCKYDLYAEDDYGNSGRARFAAPTVIDTTPPSAVLVSATPTTVTGAGNVLVISRATDDYGIVGFDVLSLVNAAGTSVSSARPAFQNGSDTDKLYASSLNVPSGLAAGTYSLVATVYDWRGVTVKVTIGTITIT